MKADRLDIISDRYKSAGELDQQVGENVVWNKQAKGRVTPRRGPSEADRENACKLDPHESKPDFKICAWPDCTNEGIFRAPKSRSHLRDFHHLCLEHIRLHNQRWDYFKDMSPGEIEAHRRADTIWHRPTWRFGAAQAHQFKDSFGFFADEQNRQKPAEEPNHQRDERQMMARLELKAGYSLKDLKSQYKLMAKKHHPDLHGGDKAAEERLKLINEAYSYLLENRLYD